MNTKKGKIVWFLYVVLLVFLFLASSTDLIIKEKKNEIFPISVVIEDTDDADYVNFRKGMELAASELNADVSFITLYDKNDLEQQRALMEREQQDSAGALIVSPVNEEKMEKDISGSRLNIPVVLLNTRLETSSAACVAAPDYVEMGRRLAEQIAASHERRIPVCLVGEASRTIASVKFEEGIREVLEDLGQEVLLYEKSEEENYQAFLGRVFQMKWQSLVFVALDQESLTGLARIFEDSIRLQAYADGLYGRGTSLAVLNALDRGTIDGLCVTDDFGIGYQSVASAVEAARSGRCRIKICPQESYYIERKDLRTEEFEKMLYPIE